MSDLKRYITHVQECDKNYDSNNYIKLAYRFKPSPKKITGISVEEKFFQKRIKIGRCKDSHIIIPDMLATTLHGEIRKQRRWIYEDLGGLTGTQVNKKTIYGKTVPININDIFRIGAYEIEVLDYSK